MSLALTIGSDPPEVSVSAPTVTTITITDRAQEVSVQVNVPAISVVGVGPQGPPGPPGADGATGPAGSGFDLEAVATVPLAVPESAGFALGYQVEGEETVLKRFPVSGVVECAVVSTGVRLYPTVELVLGPIPGVQIDDDFVLVNGAIIDSFKYVDPSIISGAAAWIAAHTETDFTSDVGAVIGALVLTPYQVSAMAFPNLLYVGGALAVNTLPVSCAAVSFPVLKAVIGSFSVTLANSGNLTTFDLPELVFAGGSMTLSGMHNVATVNLPQLRTVFGSLSFSNLGDSTATPSIDLTNLRYVNGIIISSTKLTTLALPNLVAIAGSPSITCALLGTLSLPKLELFSGSWAMSANAMTSYDFPALKVVNNTSINQTFASVANITSYSFPVLEVVNCTSSNWGCGSNTTSFFIGSTLKVMIPNVSMTGAKLDQASVDNILTVLAALDGTNGTTAYSSPRTIALTGGTSSAPSAAGLAAKAILQARGVTVTHN